MVEPAVKAMQPSGAFEIDGILERVPVIPVLTVEDRDRAVPLAQAVLAGGLSVMEIALTTDAALEAIRDIATAAPDAVVGAGGVRGMRDLADAKAAGAHFATSPGSTEPLLHSAIEAALPFLPGVATASDILRAADRGFRRMAIFPADHLGGPAAVAALGAAFPDLRFCPAAVSAASMVDYMPLECVACVTGSWIADETDRLEAAWGRVTEKAKKAAAFGGS